jgi:nucleotide-sensitive chloride channel 1A
MQLELSDPHAINGDEDEPEIVELNLIPQSADSETEIKAVFEAVSNCSNLHPDEMQEDDEMDDDRIMFEGSVGYEGVSGLPSVQQGAVDGGLPPPFPGSGGWITAENVGEYFDEAGNWIGGGQNGSEENGDIQVLGEGAGRVRGRDELDGDGLNGDSNHDADDSKWRRTD